MRTYYKELVKQAVKGAGDRTPGWDDRYRAALTELGLKMGPAEEGQGPHYPDGKAAAAARPFDDPEAWPEDTCILWKRRYGK